VGIFKSGSGLDRRGGRGPRRLEAHADLRARTSEQVGSVASRFPRGRPRLAAPKEGTKIERGRVREGAKTSG